MSASSPAPTSALATRFLIAGIAGLAVTGLGLLVSPPQNVALSYLTGFAYWTTVAIGMLLLIIIHHLTDAGWSTVIRRQYEHGVSAFKWLAVLFLPLLISAWLKPDLVWPWMNPDHVIHGGETVAADPLWVKKSGFLSRNMFTGMSVAFFAIWIGLSTLFRKASFSQDVDGDPKWTFLSRRTAAAGVVLTALSLTFAAIYWMKSLEYHWFSTMYGVWFFANCVRAGLAFAVFITVWLYNRGDYKGIFNTNQFHTLVALAFAFVVFWAYVTFSQYFLIWNANVPEETFWYNIREVNVDGTPNQWKYVGIILLLFGHFFVPFIAWLVYSWKANRKPAFIISAWVAVIILVDLCYNILPALKDHAGNAVPFFSINLLWVLSSVIGVGGICAWSYLKSFGTAKIIPIRDPRIVESLTHHEAAAPEPGHQAASAH